MPGHDVKKAEIAKCLLYVASLHRPYQLERFSLPSWDANLTGPWVGCSTPRKSGMLSLDYQLVMKGVSSFDPSTCPFLFH